MAKNKKKKSQGAHLQPQTDGSTRTEAQGFDSEPLTEAQKAALQDVLCNGACIYADHCDGWEYAPFCMLKDAGGYPTFLDDDAPPVFAGAQISKDEFAESSYCTTADLRLHPLSDQPVGYPGAICPLSSLPNSGRAAVKGNCSVEVLDKDLLGAMLAVTQTDDYVFFFVEQNDHNWTMQVHQLLSGEYICSWFIRAEDMEKMADAAGIELSEIQVQVKEI